jgi:hypothetical protein
MIDALDIFTFIVLAVLLAVAIILFMKLGALPGKIAAKRNHPQADAINVAGWFGVITLGLLWPIAIIWAYTNPHRSLRSGISEDAIETSDISDINKRLDGLENELLNLKDDKEQSQ